MAFADKRSAAPEGTGNGAYTVVQRGSGQPNASAKSLRLQRQAEALHERGPRPVGELLAEVFDRLDAEDAAWLWQRLERYNRISPEVYASVGARHFPSVPIREVSA